MQGFTTEGLTTTESLKKRMPEWNWKLGATFVGPYLDGNDLAACCLVSKDFKTSFLSVLWSNPILILKTKQEPIRKLGATYKKFAWLIQNSKYVQVHESCS
jgi:hypothetical protein